MSRKAKTDVEPKQTENPALKKAVVLVACHLGKPGDVIQISSADLAAHAGEVDANPSAVAYAEAQ